MLGRYSLVATRHGHGSSIVYKHEGRGLYLLNTTAGWVAGAASAVLRAAGDSVVAPASGWDFSVEGRHGVRWVNDSSIKHIDVHVHETALEKLHHLKSHKK